MNHPKNYILEKKDHKTSQAAIIETEYAHNARNSGDPDAELSLLEESVSSLYTKLGNSEIDIEFITSTLDLSELYYRKGIKYGNISFLLENAYKVANHLGNTRLKALVSLHIGRFFYLNNKLQDALAILSSGIEEVENIGDDDILSQSAEFHGLFYYLQGMYKEAIFYFEKTQRNLSINHKLNNIYIPVYLGYASALTGQFDRAIGVLDGNWRRARMISEDNLATRFRASIGIVLLMMGEKKEALFHLKASEKEALEQQNLRALYFAQKGIAYYLFLEGCIKESYDKIFDVIQNATSAKTISRQQTWPWLLDMLFEFTVKGLKPIPNLDLEHELQNLIRGPNVHLRGVALRIRAKQSILQGKESAATYRLLEKSLDNLKRSNNPIEIAQTMIELAKLKFAHGEESRARDFALKAWEMSSVFHKEYFPNELKSLVTLDNLSLQKGKQHELIERFVELMNDIIPEQNQEDFYNRILRVTCRFFGAERGGIILFNKIKRGYAPILKASYNLAKEEILNEQFRYNMSLILKTYKNNQPLLIRGNDHLSNTRAILCLPFETQGNVGGVLYYENSYTKEFFNLIDRSLLKKLTNQLANYIDKIMKYCQLKVKIDQLTYSENVWQNKPDTFEIKAQSIIMRELLANTDQIAQFDANVLILGETGVGKELLGRRIHQMSNRSNAHFVQLDISSIPETLVEGELFGYEKGAFTGATHQKIGRIELAHKGTLFIDELGEITKSVQVKLLRVLQEKTFMRIGGNRNIRSDFRLIAATNRDLMKAIASGEFREDLFYRVNVVPITLPPLRERGGDIIILAEFFLDLYAKKNNKTKPVLSSHEKELLMEYSWPGNIRELKNIMERAVILANDSKINLSHIMPQKNMFPNPFLKEPTLEELQREYIQYVIKATNGKIGGLGGAAEILGLKRSSLYSRMKKLGISPQ